MLTRAVNTHIRPAMLRRVNGLSGGAGRKTFYTLYFCHMIFDHRKSLVYVVFVIKLRHQKTRLERVWPAC